MCDVTSSESSFESENVEDSQVQKSSLEINSNIVVDHMDGIDNCDVNHSELKANSLKIKSFDVFKFLRSIINQILTYISKFSLFLSIFLWEI